MWAGVLNLDVGGRVEEEIGGWVCNMGWIELVVEVGVLGKESFFFFFRSWVLLLGILEFKLSEGVSLEVVFITYFVFDLENMCEFRVD